MGVSKKKHLKYYRYHFVLNFLFFLRHQSRGSFRLKPLHRFSLSPLTTYWEVPPTKIIYTTLANTGSDREPIGSAIDLRATLTVVEQGEKGDEL